jgi:hypothetical protein
VLEDGVPHDPSPEGWRVIAALVDQRKRIVEYIEQHTRTTPGGMGDSLRSKSRSAAR